MDRRARLVAKVAFHRAGLVRSLAARDQERASLHHRMMKAAERRLRIFDRRHRTRPPRASTQL